MLRIEDLSLRVRATGRLLVAGFGCTVEPGEIVRLDGESGVGKTSVSLAVCGLLHAGLEIAGGSIRLEGTELTNLDEPQWRDVRGRRIGVVFQDPTAALNPLFTCGHHLDLSQRLRSGVERAQARQRSLDQLRQCGLADPDRIYRALPAEISGGQRQRVMFALASVQNPTLLVADEPTSALDAESADVLAELLASYVRERNAGVLLITHDHLRLAGIVTRSVQLRRGGADAGPAVPFAAASPPASAVRAQSAAQLAEREAPLLQVRGLVKHFATETQRGGSNRVLSGLDFSVKSGQLLAVTGPSGIGKTTLARCLAALLVPDAGEVLLNGSPLPPRRAGPPHPVQMIYQNPNGSLSPLRTVGQTLAEALHATGVDEAGLVQRRTSELLQAVNLPVAFAARLPRHLSGGEQQRVAIARCLATEPKLLIADEPTSSLDPQNAIGILSLLRELTSMGTMAAILITHQAELAARFCDDVLVLGGRK